MRTKQQQQQQQQQQAAEKRIIAIQGGWVFIGEWHAATESAPAFMSDASCIRRWGTTAGLGQIALTGPTADTVLDPAGIVVFDNPQAVLFTIRCAPGV